MALLANTPCAPAHFVRRLCAKKTSQAQRQECECAGWGRAGPRSDRERLENLHPHFNIRMGRELGGESPLCRVCSTGRVVMMPTSVHAFLMFEHPLEPKWNGAQLCVMGQLRCPCVTAVSCNCLRIYAVAVHRMVMASRGCAGNLMQIWVMALAFAAIAPIILPFTLLWCAR